MKNKKNSPVAGVIFLVVMVAIVAGVMLISDAGRPSTDYVDGASYFHTESGETAIVVDGRLYSQKGRMVDGRIFLPVETVRNTVNPAFYWSEKEETVLVTSPLEIKTCAFGTDGSAKALMIDGTAYVPLDTVLAWSDCKADVYTDPDRVVLFTSSEMTGVYALEDTVVREEADVRTDILRDVTGGDTLLLGEAPEDMPSGWLCVTTQDGYTGFISADKVSSGFTYDVELEKNAGEYTHLLSQDKVGLVFHQTTSQAANDALGEMMEHAQGVNVVAPTWFYLESGDGEMSSLASDTYVQTAHSLGLQVWAVANDFDGAVNGTTSTLEALSTRARRETIIGKILEEVTRVGADGINLDFENVSEECAPAYLEFIRELSAECRSKSLVLSVDDYVPTYTRYLNRAEQARVADYVICMCYDEHHSGDKEAGSVASLPFVQQGIEETLQEVPAAQLIEAVPFFTRIWDGSGASLTSKAMGMWEAENYLAENGMTRNWDNEAGQYYSELLTGDSYIQVWLEDAKSLSLKLALIREKELAGAAAWKLGLETADVWPVLADALRIQS